MFRELISVTELSDEIADGALNDKVTRFACNGDVSFCSTLRALITPRLGDNEVLRCRVTDGIKTVDYYRDNPFPSNSFMLISGRTGERADNFCTELIDDEWVEIKKVRIFFQQSGYVRCFIRENTKQTILYIGDLTMSLYHYVQAAVFAYFPWYFNVSDGVSDIEMKLVNSLQQRNPDNYYECIKEISERFKLKDEFIRNALCDIDEKFYEQRVSAVKSSIENLENRLGTIYNDMDLIMRDIYEKNITLSGLVMKKQESNIGGDLLDYFLHNDKIDLNAVNDNEITFTVTGQLEYYDEICAENVINNDNSCIYRELSHIRRDDMKLLLKKIFIDKELKLRLCATYTLRLFTTNAIKPISRAAYKNQNALPNPHIHHHSCIGSERLQMISDANSRGNYLNIIEMCVASAESLNFNDGTVMEELGDDLSRNYVRCVVLPNGDIVDPVNAVKWIKENDNHNEESEDEVNE